MGYFMPKPCDKLAKLIGVIMTRKFQLTRRDCVLGIAMLLAGCGVRAVSGKWQGIANPQFDAWKRSFAANGLPSDFVQSVMARAEFIPEVITKDRNQTEVKRSLQDYLAIAATAERVSLGRAKFTTYAPQLAAIEARYGVETHVVTAIWGLESFYGTRMGEVPVMSALATLAFDGRRGAFFSGQLRAAMRILAAGDISQSQMLGSWAGAMGHTQFIPTSYLSYAVDFTGDGRRDIWGADPTDALASTASYLARSGWQRGQPWGQEVSAGLAAGRRSVSEWRAMGLRGADGGDLRGSGQATLLTTAGASFLLYSNYNVILRYNNAQSYAIGVGHLSDRLRGGASLQGDFPPDAAGMKIEDRAELQRLLSARGYDAGSADGVIGAKTNAAIAAYQGAYGLSVTGQPSLDLLARLR
jgi:membrane-bound lytic murein transglycosylase B